MNLIQCVRGGLNHGMFPDLLIQQPAEPLAGGTLPCGDNVSLVQGFLMPEPHHSWTFYFIVTLIIGYAIAKIFIGQLLNSTFMATIRYNYAASMFKDNSQLQRQRDLILFAFYFLNTAFFLMLVSEHFSFLPYGYKGFNLLVFYILLLAGLFLGRIVLTNIAGHIFLISSLLREQRYLGFAYNKMMGILLLPLNFILMYMPEIPSRFAMYLAMFVIVILLLMKGFRGIVFSQKHRVFNFYLFLYLCALEIVPLLLLYKWFTSTA
ncbi:MAG: DUF4271 domain-containing protein [Bacteroidales bacterium]|nr:DUF4271 domain-containing protein [Bacteroidales bacterium]